MIKKLISLLLAGVGSVHAAQPLVVHVTTEGSREGVIAILVFKDKKGFPDQHEKSFRKERFPVTAEGPVSCTLNDLPYGEYSLSILHDENDNYKADKLLGFGPPKEPVGFSNIDKKLRKKPAFRNTMISFNADNTEFSVPLFYVF
jgi:uncharacterized protein (DUF2141 family)